MVLKKVTESEEAMMGLLNQKHSNIVKVLFYAVFFCSFIIIIIECFFFNIFFLMKYKSTGLSSPQTKRWGLFCYGILRRGRFTKLYR